MRYRLGVAVRVVGAPLRAYDSRRPHHAPHLSVSLAYLRDLLGYLAQHQIGLYRLPGQLAPYLTHPDLPQFHHQLEECAVELAAVGDLARHAQIRLTLHPAFYVQLNSTEPRLILAARRELSAAAALLDGLGVGSEGVIVVHVGRADNRTGRGVGTGRARFVAAFAELPAEVRSRLALENDDRAYGMDDLVWIHKRTGIRLVFDLLHHHCFNPTKLPLIEALTWALGSWPPGEQPKIHLSSPRTELRRSVRRGVEHLQLPLANQHSDFIHPFEAIDLIRRAQAAGLPPFDIMLEAKAHELALIRLRQHLARFAPDLAPHIY
jgi:UV DNA damage endonuclease